MSEELRHSGVGQEGVNTGSRVPKKKKKGWISATPHSIYSSAKRDGRSGSHVTQELWQSREKPALSCPTL